VTVPPSTYDRDDDEEHAEEPAGDDDPTEWREGCQLWLFVAVAIASVGSLAAWDLLGATRHRS
jgi:hypothetical protein